MQHALIVLTHGTIVAVEATPMTSLLPMGLYSGFQTVLAGGVIAAAGHVGAGRATGG